MYDVHILIADGDQKNRMLIKSHVTAEGYDCEEAADGIAALKLFRRHEYDVVILDSGLGELDTWNVCLQMRKSAATPIIVLSGPCSEYEKLLYFDAGADDFLCKPISYRELIARIRVILRHKEAKDGYGARRVKYGGLCIDFVSRSVSVDGRSVGLTPREYNLLQYLAQNPNKALSREQILNDVWGADFFGTDRTVDTHIKTLRENIKPYHEYIATVWGFGYMFKV